MKTASGHTIVPLEGEELARHERDFRGYTEGLVHLMPGRWLFPAVCEQFLDKYYKFEIKRDDVMVLTYPKCGTTWMQEVVWTMKNNPNLDNPMANMAVNARVPFLEMDIHNKSKNLPPITPDHPFMQAFKKMCPGRDPKDGLFLQISELLPSPRTFKSHLPLSLLPQNFLTTGKVVYIARNPKDVVLSCYHYSRIFKGRGYGGTFEQFVQYFVDDDLLYGPYWLHLKEALGQRDNPNMHFMFYEDLKQNTLHELKRLNDFLGTRLTEEQLKGVAHYTSFPEMKARDGFLDSGAESFFNTDIVNKDGGFFRKGTVGDWKGKYSPELEAKMDNWIKTNLADLNIHFKYSQECKPGSQTTPTKNGL